MSYKEPQPVERECGHLDPYLRLTRWTVDGPPRPAAVCHVCAAQSAQQQAIPCSGCGGFDPRPGWPGEFNAPTGYWGGGFHEGVWFPWCVECLEPLPNSCMGCLGGGLAWVKHSCGQPLDMVPDAPRNLWLRLLHCATYPGDGLELRHLLGARDWPGWSDVQPLGLPDAVSLWPSYAEALEAIEPFADAHRLQVAAERRERDQQAAEKAAQPVQMSWAL